MYKFIDKNTVSLSPDCISFSMANYQNDEKLKIIAFILGYGEMTETIAPDDGKNYVPVYSLSYEKKTFEISVPKVQMEWQEVE